MFHKSYYSLVDILLCGIALIYLCAFASLYTQTDGLYSEKGILPIHKLVKQGKLIELSDNWHDNIFIYILLNGCCYFQYGALKIAKRYVIIFSAAHWE